MNEENTSFFDIDRILRVLEHAEQRVITVFGDYSLDKYVYSKPSRDEESVETGLIAYQIHETASYAGIGGTVANNLRSLGAQVICIGLVGIDGHGFELMDQLEKIGADTRLMISSKQLLTNTYMKPMRGETRESASEMSRLDFRNFEETPRELEDRLLRNLEQAVQQSQGVIITDQFRKRNCSAVTDRVRDGISALALKYPNVFFYADSRGFISEYRNVIRKCNEHEHGGTELSGLRIVTMGEKGILLCEENEKTHIPSFPAKPPLDICGAGDATNAGIMLGLTLGLDKKEAALLGACVASVTIEQIGVTGTATREQVKARMYEKKHFFSVNL
jgi:bifunctional ADP-heptose synthase (sugar kinase/adenylyltransferase)